MLAPVKRAGILKLLNLAPACLYNPVVRDKNHGKVHVYPWPLSYWSGYLNFKHYLWRTWILFEQKDKILKLMVFSVKQDRDHAACIQNAVNFLVT